MMSSRYKNYYHVTPFKDYCNSISLKTNKIYHKIKILAWQKALAAKMQERPVIGLQQQNQKTNY
ncbi:hypothetical protein NUZ5A_51006 [Candidatus Nitrosotenuis uzonensis]|uniref:Uncharacterized protein n=1 Tax=Candidatus Nitrosotenuis uzonensis TaxID=1407055 RepID=A0A812EYN8_9ARCH|nr:hypothetical protein NUZ5A_51006 [Candidatus Nitrosotenuis uzonensis]